MPLTQTTKSTKYVRTLARVELHYYSCSYLAVLMIAARASGEKNPQPSEGIWTKVSPS